MKKLNRKLFLGFAALAAMTVQAENKVYFQEAVIEPGGDPIWVDLIFENYGIYPEKIATSGTELKQWQVFVAPVPGITFMSAAIPNDRSMSLFHYNEDMEDYDNLTMAYNFDENDERFGACFKMVSTCQMDDEHKPVMGTGTMARVRIKADETFTGGKLQIKYVKWCANEYDENGKMISGDYSWDEWNPECPYDLLIPSQVQEATPLADIVANGEENRFYRIADPLHNVLFAEGEGEYVFVSDGNNNWIRLISATPNLIGDVSDIEDFAAGAVEGTLSRANGNQTLTLYKVPEEEADEPVIVEIEDWALAQTDINDPHFHFRPKVNQVINLSGIYDKDAKRLKGFAQGESQWVDVNTEWMSTANARTLANQGDGKYVKLPNVAMLIKEPWDAATPAEGAPARVAATDPTAFMNYTAHGTEFARGDVLTGVADINTGKTVAATKYVNVAGQSSTTPFEGVNIVVTTYSDGSQTTTKVIK